MTTVPPGWPVPELPSPPPPAGRPEPHRPTPGFTFLAPPPSDVDDQLLRRRIVMLSGPLDPATAQAAAARLMLADADSPDPVELVVNCPDGDLAAAVMLTETVQLMRARVVATASGTVGGPALGVYAAARHRRAHPHARFAFSEPRATFAGTADRIEAETAMHRDQAEHYQRYNVIWRGERGRVVMFQNELPYDAPTQADWAHDGVNGWAAYKVADTVRTHEAWGLGSYIYTNVNPDLHATNAFEVPVRPGIRMHDLLTVSLNKAGTIDHVINGVGAAVTPTVQGPTYIVSYP